MRALRGSTAPASRRRSCRSHVDTCGCWGWKVNGEHQTRWFQSRQQRKMSQCYLHGGRGLTAGCTRPAWPRHMAGPNGAACCQAPHQLPEQRSGGHASWAVAASPSFPEGNTTSWLSKSSQGNTAFFCRPTCWMQASSVASMPQLHWMALSLAHVHSSPCRTARSRSVCRDEVKERRVRACVPELGRWSSVAGLHPSPLPAPHAPHSHPAPAPSRHPRPSTHPRWRGAQSPSTAAGTCWAAQWSRRPASKGKGRQAGDGGLEVSWRRVEGSAW